MGSGLRVWDLGIRALGFGVKGIGLRGYGLDPEFDLVLVARSVMKEWDKNMVISMSWVGYMRPRLNSLTGG